MDQMLHVLASNTLLSEGQIYRIKNYIYSKYPHILEHKKVELLSNTLHHVLDDTLKEFEGTYRSLLRKRIIENTLAKGQMNISQSDVIHSYFGLDHKPENTLHSLKEWLKSKGWEATVAENITQYFSESLYQHSTIISSDWNTDSLITKSALLLFSGIYIVHWIIVHCTFFSANEKAHPIGCAFF